MRSIVLAVMLVGSILFTAINLSGQEKAAPTAAAPVKWVAKDGVSAAPAAASGRRELTIRQRREMGLNLSNLVEVAKELKAEGEIDRDTPRSEIAAAIAVRLESKNAAAFKESAALDWESIIAFIERLLPLILKLIELFS